jgi:L-lysine exporter family protein LysE/ArgO
MPTGVGRGLETRRGGAAVLDPDIVHQAGAAGFLLGLGFAFSIGPQNLRLIQGGLTRSHGWTIATVGLVSEIVIVLAGPMGFGQALAAAPDLSRFLQVLGIAFVGWCGLNALIRRSDDLLPIGDGAPQGTRGKAIVSMLVVTWLNPLVYLEVLVLLGALAANFEGTRRLAFFAGYLLAAAVKFYGLTFAGRAAAPWLGRRGRQVCPGLSL